MMPTQQASTVENTAVNRVLCPLPLPMDVEFLMSLTDWLLKVKPAFTQSALLGWVFFFLQN